MNLGEAISSVFSKYATFSGRARRSEYWFWMLCFYAIIFVGAFLDGIVSGMSGTESSPVSLVLAVVVLGLFLPTWAVRVRRLHDTDRSGWWLLIAFVPLVGTIVLFIFDVLDSTAGTNDYGPEIGRAHV